MSDEKDNDVFPTRVGVDRLRVAGRLRAKTFSPRAWGWTRCRAGIGRGGRVFPTRVGVDRSRPAPQAYGSRFPHARGGGPVAGERRVAIRVFSPRAWGWTAVRRRQLSAPPVFPTRVGVDQMAARWTRVPVLAGAINLLGEKI